MSKKSNAILMICLWGFLTFARYYDFLVADGFNPKMFDWFVLIGGPIIIILEIWQLHKAKKEK